MQSQVPTFVFDLVISLQSAKWHSKVFVNALWAFIKNAVPVHGRRQAIKKRVRAEPKKEALGA